MKMTAYPIKSRRIHDNMVIQTSCIMLSDDDPYYEHIIVGCYSISDAGNELAWEDFVHYADSYRLHGILSYDQFRRKFWRCAANRKKVFVEPTSVFSLGVKFRYLADTRIV